MHEGFASKGPTLEGPTLEGPTLRDVHEGTAFKDSQPSTKALPLWSDLDMLPTKASPLRPDP